MITDCAYYRDGRRQHVEAMSVEEAAAHCQQGGFVWLGMFEPSGEELDQVRESFGLHELAVEDAKSFHLRPKVEEYETGVQLVILRTARFFPEEDDMAHEIIQSGANTKANEFLFRRLTVEDAASAHIAALDRAPQIGFDTFIISALTPFSPEDCEQLMEYAPLVVHRYFPRYREIYARRGWTMFDYIDRVYDSNKAMRRLGFVCRTDFGDILAQLDREDGV